LRLGVLVSASDPLARASRCLACRLSPLGCAVRTIARFLSTAACQLSIFLCDRIAGSPVPVNVQICGAQCFLFDCGPDECVDHTVARTRDRAVSITFAATS
jgi:hypothetical protein